MEDFKAIKKKSVVDEIIDQIMQRITSGVWVAGTQIPSENELAKMMNVSRATVRTALQRLIAWDLLESRVGEGTFVKSLTGEVVAGPLIKIIALHNRSVVELLQFRRGVEFVICKVAAEIATDDEIAELGRIVGRLKVAADQRDVGSYRQIDGEFHSYMAKISKISLMESTMNMLRSALSDYFAGRQSDDNIRGNFPHHLGMYEAVRDHDPMRAVYHMDNNLQNLIEKVEEREKHPVKS